MSLGALSDGDAARSRSLTFELTCVLDETGHVLRANGEWTGLLGRPVDELGSVTLQDLLHPDDAVAVRDAMARVGPDAASASVTARCLHADGEYRLLEWRFGEPVEGDVCACARDVTERRRQADATEALRVLEDEAEQVADLGSWRLDLATGSLRWSPQMFRIFGADPQRGQADLKAVIEAALHPDDRERMLEIDRLTMADRVPREVEYRIVRPDGSVRWVHTRGRQVTDAAGLVIALAGFVQDVTERKRGESTAAEREMRLRAVIDNAPFGAHLYRLDEDDRLRFIGYNQKATAMLGIDHERLFGRTLEEAFPGNIGTETPERYRGVALTGIPWETEQYAYDAQGVAGVFQVYAFSFGPRKVSVFFRDITTEKLNESRLLESEQRFRVAFDQAAVGMSEQAPDGRFARVNDRLCEILGYSREELASLTSVEITHPDDRAADLPRVREMAAGERDRYTVEKRYIRKDGSVVWTCLSAAPVSTSAGLLRYFVTAVEDISARKTAEDALLKSNESLAQMVRDVAETMGRVAEARDPYTRDHEKRVAGLARLLGVEMGLSDDELEGLNMACLLHDVGKMRIPVEILTKPGKLSNAEFALIKEHPVEGYEILRGISFPWPIAEIVLQHHERIDGSGYPRGLTGADILPAARILAVADVVEAMATNRPYRPALGVDAAMVELRDFGAKYDAEVVAACRKVHAAGLIDL